MNTFNNLPLYIIDVDGNLTSEEGVDFVALVDKPAIKRGYLAFNEHAPKNLAFTVSSEDRRIVSGPLMVADTPIYRADEYDGYYVSFPPKVIETIAQKFFAQGNQSNVNEMHDGDKTLKDVVMFESFISDKSRGIAPMRGYEDLPEGSWFGSFKVNNDEAWAKVKAGDFTGFSVEGIFREVYNPNMRDQFTADEWEKLSILNEALKNIA